MRKLLALLLPVLYLFQSCEKAPVPEPELLSYSFLKSSNYSLFYDIELEIVGNTAINCTIPFPVDISLLKASFEVSEGCTVTVEGVPQTSGTTPNDFSSPVVYTVTNSAGVQKSYTICLSVGYKNITGLPLLFINTNNSAPIYDKENWVAGEFSIMDSNGEYVLENNELEIKGRGNTTWQNPKKPYAIKLGKKTELFGMPKHKRWVLLAAYNDKSFIRTDLAFHLAQKYSNLRWKQGGQLVDLVLNGRYLGNYYICEHIKIDENRIPDGYVLEVDYRAKAANGDIFFKSRLSKLNFVIKDPDVELNSDEFRYLENYINNLEMDLNDNNIGSMLTVLVYKNWSLHGHYKSLQIIGGKIMLLQMTVQYGRRKRYLVHVHTASL